VTRETKLIAYRKAVRAVDVVSKRANVVRAGVNRVGFPYRAPTTPRSVEPLPKVSKIGGDYETEWARGPGSKVVRRLIVNGPMKAAIRLTADPEITGADRLADLSRRGKKAPAMIFVANHHSHLDAALMLTSIPLPWRNKMFVVAAADYFFTTRVTSAASALALGAVPLDRTSINRKSSDQAAELLNDGWSMLIFPEGGRSPDGWGQPFKGGAAFLADKCGVAVVPVHLDGTGAIWGKGSKRLKPGRTKVTFGAPLFMRDDENVRRFGDRIEQSVGALGDESLDDWWTSRQRAASKSTTSLTGPAANGWRRSWALSTERAKGKAGQRRRQQRRWPKLDET
jgi:1-acyl-sn-glycerol-3-phosphate acyltransferase